MEKSGTKADRYKPIAIEKKPLGVLINPDSLGKPVQELCSLAKMGRIRYYDAMSKDGFADLISETTMDPIEGKASGAPNAAYKYVLTERGYQNREVILVIAGIYADKQELKHSGGVDIRRQYEKTSDEELEESVKRHEKINDS